MLNSVNHHLAQPNPVHKQNTANQHSTDGSRFSLDSQRAEKSIQADKLATQAQTPAVQHSPAPTGQNQANEENKDIPSSKERLMQINQLILDARLGIDRRKIDELEKKMEAVRNDPDLTLEEKQQKLQAMQSEIERLLEEARKRTVEEEKRKAATMVAF